MSSNNWSTSDRSAQVWVLRRRFDGTPTADDFERQEHQLRAIDDGELICAAEWLSVDPYMRLAMDRINVFPNPMVGTQVAKVIESKNSAYPVGSYIYGHFGWRTHTLVADLDDAAVHPIRPYPCPDTGAHPRSYALGCMGRVGNSAYFGLFELCQPKAGETVVVSGAAGAVGSLVGQLAKAKGCRVIGIAGGAEKCDWLRNELGFDATVDYKAASDGDGLATALELAAPDGVDCYFDNVGGLISYAVTMRMNQRGRIAVCGSISAYNLKTGEVLRVPPVLDFHRRLLRMEGFQVNRWLGARWFEGINYIKKCLDEGTVKHTETVTQGFDQMPSAFIALFNGGNVGKAIVKV